MRIHKEGIKIIFTSFVLLLIIAVGTTLLLPDFLILNTIISSFCLLVFILVVRFFRNPIRNLDPNDDIITSPADGTIVVIEETTENEYLKEKYIQVSIFMSVHNIHVNRYPISGEIEFYKYHSGKYLVACLPKSSTFNERNTIVIKAKNGKKVLVRQIAGFIARRIVCYVKRNSSVVQGQELGFIRFGSRVDVFVPLGTDIKVKIGEKVKANRSIIAKF